ncbi:hypothetical protein KP77_32640 [Jeotgalibacillus alimentarius]|uniref:Glycosyltransferase subfamily 4-like N-terminal domain-containing protein n=1 Tax=Jeotgalibacillus alimentarius TaxID=135826 RepID=A0A0C2VHU3_9BACL|nr:hypothetical protein [Jeotgalibacillus alimentarius]KIL43558.1 hypothetical protein KP77_32640 [Jeotgalibacillus alimentarius]
MKILLLGVQKIKFMPYIDFYLSNLDTEQHDIHLLYWNRDKQEDVAITENITLHEFSHVQEDEVSKIRKIKGFIKYRRRALELIRKERFDFIIVLNTATGFLVQDLLWSTYRKKYIYDYRDPTHENLFWYKWLVGRIARHSHVTFVSSDGFRKFLPLYEHIHTSHNLISEALLKREIRNQQQRTQNPIRIRYWGMIRDEEMNKALINKLANDLRFELHYNGRMQKTGKNLQNFCREQQINNVFFHGSYLPDERYQFIEETDILHNVYKEDKLLSQAMGNKFYDGVIHYIPQILTAGSFMGAKGSESGTGIEYDPQDPDFADKLYHYYTSMNWNEFIRNCDSCLDQILTEYSQGQQMLWNIFDTHPEPVQHSKATS